jgi:hypothetical protein
MNTYEPEAGEDIQTAAEAVYKQMVASNKRIRLIFNDTEVIAIPGMTAQNIANIWWNERRAMELAKEKNAASAAWNLLKAAESALIRLESCIDLFGLWEGDGVDFEDNDNLPEECLNAAHYLREAITAYKEAKNETAG